MGRWFQSCRWLLIYHLQERLLGREWTEEHIWEVKRLKGTARRSWERGRTFGWELVHLGSEKAGGWHGLIRAQILGFLRKLAEMPFDAGDPTASKIRGFPSAKKMSFLINFFINEFVHYPVLLFFHGLDYSVTKYYSATYHCQTLFISPSRLQQPHLWSWNHRRSQISGLWEEGNENVAHSAQYIISPNKC